MLLQSLRVEDAPDNELHELGPLDARGELFLRRFRVLGEAKGAADGLRRWQ